MLRCFHTHAGSFTPLFPPHIVLSMRATLALEIGMTDDTRMKDFSVTWYRGNDLIDSESTFLLRGVAVPGVYSAYVHRNSLLLDTYSVKVGERNVIFPYVLKCKSFY